VAAFGVRCCEHGCQHAGFSEVSPGETNHVSSLHFCDKHAAAYHPPLPREKKTSVLGHFRPTARNSPKDDVTRGGGCSTTTPGAARPPSHSALDSTADSGTCAGGGGATSSTASNFTRMEYLPLPVHAAAGMLTGGDSAVTMGDKGTCAGGAAAALLKELISTVDALEHDVAVELGRSGPLRQCQSRKFTRATPSGSEARVA